MHDCIKDVSVGLGATVERRTANSDTTKELVNRHNSIDNMTNIESQTDCHNTASSLTAVFASVKKETFCLKTKIK